ncbi:TonB-dependent siderophore receptor [Aureimonas sp. SK2]|uniref:TonB-dependent siderophore receptor n=1 Tax=Aureimonas sp. SK2 TaxID=3015992 RepID=UPI002444AFEE|nr:TonB-dependent siderophore receptor [Aureimonas sp. SK2]
MVLDTVVVDGAGSGSGGAATGVGIGGGLKTDGYVRREARVGTKTDTDLRKVPQAVSVVSRQELDDRNVQTLVEAARYSAGVRAGTFGFDPAFDTLYVRGFNVANTGYYRDGLRSLGGSFAFFRNEPYGLEGVSILKGPSSVLYGASAPGGIVNLVTKRPTDAPFREVVGQIGTDNHYQANFDASGPLGGNGNVLYRLTGIKRSADTEFVAARDDRTYIAPAFTLRSDDRDTQFTFLSEYTDTKSGGGRGFYTTPDARITGIEQGDPAFRDLDQTQGRVGYEFEHRFNENLAVRQNLRYQSIRTDMRFTSVLGINPGGLSAFRSAGEILDDADGLAVDNQIQGNFQTGAVAHTLLGGLDYTYFDGQYRYGGASAPDLNLVTRNYGAQPIAGPTSHNLVNTTTHQSQIGLYLQDQAEYERLVLTIGGRYDWLDTDTFNNNDPSATVRAEDRNFSGRVGLSYLFDNGVTPYANVSTSFAPTVGTAFDGSPFDPTRGEQVEVGVKYAPDWIGLTVDAALFRIEQDNLLVTDPVNTAGFFQIQTGAVRSQGFELQANAALAEGLSLVAAYSYTDISFTEGDNVGNQVAGIPEHQFSLWGNYEVQSGAAEGLGLGIGSRFLGANPANDANTRENDSRILVDAAVSYDFGAANPRLEGIRAQVNANNLFDNRASLCNNGYCYREQGRDVIGSLRFRF